MSDHVCCGCHDKAVDKTLRDLLARSQQRERAVRETLIRMANGCWSGPFSILDGVPRKRLDDAESELASATDLANMWAREMGVEEASDIYGLRLLVDRLWTASSLRMAELALKMEGE